MRWIFIGLVTVLSAAEQPSEWTKLVTQGDTFIRNGNSQDALAPYTAALKLAAAFDPTDRRIAVISNKLAMTYHDLGRFREALPLYRRAMTVVERSLGKNSEEYTALLTNVAAICLMQNQYSKSEALVREAIAIDESMFPPESLETAKARSMLANLFLQRNRLDEAANLLLQVVHAFENQPDNKRDLGVALNNLGVVRRFQKQLAESRRLLETAVATITSDTGPGHPALARPYNNLGSTYADLGLRDLAEAAFRESVRIAETRLGVQHPECGVILHNYALFLKDTGRKSEAKTVEARSRSVLQESARRNGLGMTVDVSAFAGR